MATAKLRTPEQAADHISRCYARLERSQRTLENKKNELRKLAADLLDLMQTDKICGSAGTIQWVQPTMVTSYDKHALEAVAKHDDHLQEILSAHRSEKPRAGYIKFT
jgi:hypothetical protein